MASSLYDFQQLAKTFQTEGIRNFLDQNRESAYQKLDSIHMHLKRHIEQKRLSLVTIFTLTNFVKDYESYIFLDKGIQLRFINILTDFLLSPAYEKCDSKKLHNFLVAFYECPDTKMSTLLKSWQNSNFFLGSVSMPNLINEKIDLEILDISYFNIIVAWTDKAVRENVYYLPTYFDLGLFNVKIFFDFLERFQIPVSGPYVKNKNTDNPRITYYVQSQNKNDNIYNGNIPFYGIYEFPLESIILPKDLGLNYVRTLPLLPEWLMTYGPADIRFSK